MGLSNCCREMVLQHNGGESGIRTLDSVNCRFHIARYAKLAEVILDKPRGSMQ